MKRRSGFCITVAGCPVLWKSSLMSEIAASTMEAETVSEMRCRELCLVVDLVERIGSAAGLPSERMSKDARYRL